MSYLTLQFQNAAGDFLYQTDFTLHEFIPVVRHTLRSLASQPELVANPTGYRVFLKPCYDTPPSGSPHEVAADTAPSPQPAPLEDGSLLHISEEDLDVYAPISYLDEIEAYYNPGTSALCVHCPDRLRCPGSGQVALTTDLGGWIELDPDSVRSNERVRYFLLRVETLSGRVIHTSEIRIQKLLYFMYLVLGLLSDAGRRVRGAKRSVIIARFEGQPQIDPALRPALRPAQWPRVAFRDAAAFSPVAAHPAPLERPRRLVDWDRLEEQPVAPAQTAAPGSPAASDLLDIDIKVFPSETDPLPHRSPPPSEVLPGTRLNPDELQIFLHRPVLAAINAQRDNVRAEVGGILIGDAIVDPSTGRTYVEIVAALATADANGEHTRVTLDSRILREIQDRIDRDYPGRRTVGWYQFHLLRLTVRTSGSVLTAGIVGEPLDLLDDEVFLHRNFFPQPWHVGMVIDPMQGGLRFYHLQNGEIAVSNSCRVVR